MDSYECSYEHLISGAWKITVFSPFGSVLREDFGPGKDVDVLMSFEESATWSLIDLVEMRTGLVEGSKLRYI